jgi:prepilin-type N-terminal cleavage/methylation domain-containing protein
VAPGRPAGGRRRGFTLTELLIAIMITGIILSAVASLTYAVSRLWAHNGASDQVGHHLDSAAGQVSSAVRGCRVVLHEGASRVGLWGGDLDADGEIDVRELVLIGYQPARQRLVRIQWDASPATAEVSPDAFVGADGWSQVVDAHEAVKKEAVLAEDVTACSFTLDKPPPETRRMTVELTIVQGGYSRTSRFTASVRSLDTDMVRRVLGE